uniref:Uncharacterized protein n=1 Tax=Timema shepardi TaxID=629360 RepID=A0A7R9ARJ4_TIMSH|nr:unnamed protein product [Timema shepardi]
MVSLVLTDSFEKLPDQITTGRHSLYRQQNGLTVTILRYSSPVTSLVLADSSQLTTDGVEKLPDQIILIQHEISALDQAATEAGITLFGEAKTDLSKMESVQRNPAPVERQDPAQQRDLAVLAHAIDYVEITLAHVCGHTV